MLLLPLSPLAKEYHLPELLPVGTGKVPAMTEHVDTTTEIRWYCTSCSALVHGDDIGSIPKECPECDYYHCGDMDCCIGEGFTSMLLAKYENSLASPTVEDICFHGSMFNPNCPVCVERRKS